MLRGAALEHRKMSPATKGRPGMTLGSPRVRLALVLSAVTACAALPPLAAQTPAPDPMKSRLLQLTIATLRPDMVKTYIDYQKSDVIPALQKGGVKWRDSWRTASFGDIFQVAHVTDVTSLDQYDAPPPARKALGDEGYAAYQAKIGSMVSSVRTYLIRTRPDLSYMPDPAAPQPKMAILTTIEVAPDKIAEYEAFIKSDWIPALKTGGGKLYEVSQVVYGGSLSQYFSLVGVDSFADIAKGHPVTRALGEEGMIKLTAKVGSYTRRVERTIIRLDPDLTFAVKATSEMK
jgi:hypothetical protein